MDHRRYLEALTVRVRDRTSSRLSPIHGIGEGDRTRALAAGAPPVPRRFILWMVAAVILLGGGGAIVERVLDDHGIPSFSQSAGSPTTASATAGSSNSTTASKLLRFMGASAVDVTPAPQFVLVDQYGATVSLAKLRGKVAVLLFVDAACDDLCPVLLDEVRVAERSLGPVAQRVHFVAINTDPLATSKSAALITSVRFGLDGFRNWYFLTGPISSLDRVWTAYGVTVEVGRSDHKVAHTDVMYFIGPDGYFRERATPFANEAASGRETLPASIIKQYGSDIAAVATSFVFRGDG